MTYHDEPDDLDEQEFYEAKFGRTQRGQKVSRRGKQPAPRDAKQVAKLTEDAVAEAPFATTYQPSRFEAGWLRDSLRSFYDERLISDVLASVKGGKEASVYCCRAELQTGQELLAAKVYRPRQFRNLRNDKIYRDGRTVLTADGKAAKNSDERLMRALGKKTSFGQQVSHTSWLMHEFSTLDALHRLGAAVPKPYAANDNALLMTYCGVEGAAAPTLSGVRLDRAEAELLFAEVLRNIELMLTQGMVHGDLSAYNILYWEGAITLIDFPQVTHIASNPHAQTILVRDVTRVCEYFIGQGVRARPQQIAAELWERFATIDPDDALADASREPS